MKMMVVDEFLEQGFPKKQVLSGVGISRSSYYNVSNGLKRGKKPDKFVYDKNNVSHEMNHILGEIKSLLSNEFVDYGYYKTYHYLKDTLGYNIGAYRTYSLMKNNNLLKFQRNEKKRVSKQWVKDLLPQVETEFSFLEFDIKYFYIQGKRTNVQVLSIIDVHTRWLLAHHIATSIRSEDVINLFEEIVKTYPMPKHFIVRNDNGSQFDALIVQQYLKNKGITQEFTKPSTPQQNAHIESYHSIIESAICQRFEFYDINEFKETMSKWKKFYNFERIHGGLKFKSPKKYLESIGVTIDPSWLN